MKTLSFNPFRQFKKNTADLEQELTDLVVKERPRIAALWRPPEHLIEERVGFCNSLAGQFEQALANPNDDLFGYRGQAIMSLEGAARFVAFASDRDDLKQKIEQAVRRHYPTNFATDEEKRERLAKIDERIKEISRQLVAAYDELESADVEVLPSEHIDPAVYLRLE